MREYATDVSVRESCIAQADVEGLNRVRNHAAIELAKSFEVSRSQQWCTVHATFLSGVSLG
jgi:hypothetical protein